MAVNKGEKVVPKVQEFWSSNVMLDTWQILKLATVKMVAAKQR
jgi:hypothetical protein